MMASDQQGETRIPLSFWEYTGELAPVCAKSAGLSPMEIVDLLAEMGHWQGLANYLRHRNKWLEKKLTGAGDENGLAKLAMRREQMIAGLEYEREHGIGSLAYPQHQMFIECNSAMAMFLEGEDDKELEDGWAPYFEPWHQYRYIHPFDGYIDYKRGLDTPYAHGPEGRRRG